MYSSISGFTMSIAAAYRLASTADRMTVAERVRFVGGDQQPSFAREAEVHRFRARHPPELAFRRRPTSGCRRRPPTTSRTTADSRRSSSNPVTVYGELDGPRGVRLPNARPRAAPGEPPFTRGVYPRCTAGGCGRCASTRAWRTADETNARFRYLLEHGQTGLSVAFDLPTQMGLDSDHPRAEGEVGKTGVAIDSIEDMRRLFDGDPARPRLDVDDDQRDRADPAAALRAGRRGAGHRRRRRSAAPSRTTC